MKRILLVLAVLVILGFGFVYFGKNNTKSTESTLPIVASTIAPSLNCLASDFQAGLSVDHAAGNVYGKLILKNVSHKVCQVIGNNFITPTYDTQIVKNVSVENQGKPEKNIFVLNSDQELYSQIHYPNGPQCSDEIKEANVQFTYAISQGVSVVFVDTEGNKDQVVQVCKSPAEVTTIQVWNMSSTPITP